MTHAVYWGQVAHTRFAPKEHSFSYGLFFLGIDLGALKESGIRLFPLLDTKTPALCSLRNRDYLEDNDTPIIDKLVTVLHRCGDERGFARALLLTMPRVLGYVFNPVNFYLCFSEEGEITSLLCEVSNTFGERHIYHSAQGSKIPNSNRIEFPLTKEFYVSPFIAVSGDYTVGVTLSEHYLAVEVALSQEGSPRLSASLSGVPHPLVRPNLVQTIFKFPFCNLMTMFRIHWQAVVLLLLRGVSVFMKPEPTRSWKTRVSSGWVHSVRLAFLGVVKSLRER